MFGSLCLLLPICAIFQALVRPWACEFDIVNEIAGEYCRSSDQTSAQSLRTYDANGRRLSGERPGPLLFGHFVVKEAIQIFIVMIGAAIYNSSVSSVRPPWPIPVAAEWSMANSQEFKAGICGCFEDIQACMHGLCCFHCRVADTWKAPGLNEFWTSIMAVLVSIEGGAIASFFSWNRIVMPVFGDKLTQTYLNILHDSGKETADAYTTIVKCLHLFIWLSLFNIAFAYYAAVKRQGVRQKCGGQPMGTGMDFLLWWCCTCCAAVQEARQVDGAQGVAVSCCCNLAQAEGAQLVGSAVEMGSMQQPMMVAGQPVQQKMVVAGQPGQQPMMVAGATPQQAMMAAPPMSQAQIAGNPGNAEFSQAATITSPAASVLNVQCPPGSGPGDVVQVPLPDGTQRQVAIPQGVSAGQIFSVQV